MGASISRYVTPDVGPFTRLAGIGCRHQEIDKLRQRGQRAKEKQAGQVATCPLVLGKMAEQRSAVPRDKDAAFALRREEDFGIRRAAGEIGSVADAHHVQGIGPTLVVPTDRLPELAPQLFIEKEADVHGSGTLGALLGLQATL